MKLTLNRKFKGQTYTIGDLSIDGKFFCNTIEDVVRNFRQPVRTLPVVAPVPARKKSMPRQPFLPGLIKSPFSTVPGTRRKCHICMMCHISSASWSTPAIQKSIPPAVSSWERILSKEKFWNPVPLSKNCMPYSSPKRT